jgi:Spy/CpxP family protein refolding chaperone
MEEEIMNRQRMRSSIWIRTCVLGSALTLAVGIPAWAGTTGYEHGKAHGDSPHHGQSYSDHGSSHSGMTGHGMSAPGTHGKAPHGSGVHGGSGHHVSKGMHSGTSMHSTSSGHMGGHQSATKFIDHILKFKEGMAITDQQESQLNTIKTAYKRNRIKMKAEVELANLDLHEVLKDENAHLSGIESKLKQVHALKADLYMASIKAKRDAKGVLTPEQRSRMKAVHDRIKTHGSKMKSGYSKKYKQHSKLENKGAY